MAEYSNRLAEALARQPDVEPVVLAGRADEHRSVPEELDGIEVHDVAEIGLWRNDGRYSLDYDTILRLGLDVLHVQYQSMLWGPFTDPDRWALSQVMQAFSGPTAVTFHDNCQQSNFPYHRFDLKFSHRWNVGPPDVEVIPFGIEDRPPVVRSFGLGRNQDALIHDLCASNGWVFESAALHEPIHGGNYEGWCTHEQLIGWLRGADAIVLWYPDHDQAGSSQAARTALAARRPVFTNQTRWFEDLPPVARTADGGTTYFEKVPDLPGLRYALWCCFARPYVDKNSWDHVARTLLDRYAAVGAPT